jgi:hypothetical protein
MIWQSGDFIGKVEYDTDALGNPVTEDQALGTYDCRLTDWNSEEHETLGREYTESHRKLLTKAPLNIIAAAYAVDVEEARYRAGTIKGNMYSRWRIVHLDAYKVKQNGC